MPTTLLLVDDHFVVRSGLSASLSLEPDLQIVAEADTAEDALTQYRSLRPTAVIMDMQLGSGLSGIECTARLCAEFSSARILIFSSFARDDDIYRAIRAGALGYLQKSAPRTELLQAVRTIATGQRFLPLEIAHRLAERLAKPEPSPREREILILMSQGRGNKEIAAHLGLSEDTVKRHVSNVMEKLGAQDRTQAVTEALRRGFIDV